MILRSQILNELIKKYNYESYLEVGVCETKFNFDLINCKYKECVDPHPRNTQGITYLLTSNDAFNRIKEQGKKYDLIFIDGLHTEDQVDRDIINSLEVLTHNGTIMLHDCNPPTIYHGLNDPTAALKYTLDWNGTVYKSIIKFAKLNKCIFVIDTDWGCGIIQPWKQSEKCVVDANLLQIDWDVFDKNRKQLLNLVDYSTSVL